MSRMVMLIGLIGRKKDMFCSHCGLLGHVVDKCYKIHVYPPSYRNKGKDNPANQVSLSTDFSMDGAKELTALSASQCQLIISILHSHALGSQPSS